MARAGAMHGVRRLPKGRVQANKMHVSLHERILYPSPKGPRPPRVLHSAAHDVLDPLILDLIALICREHILSWYSSISTDPDRAFIQQVSAVLIHVIQALEVRLTQVDFVQLLALDLPALLEQHVADFDEATNKANSGHAHNVSRDHMFHHLQPHIAITLAEGLATTSPRDTVATVDGTYLRALVENVLRLLLPPEDHRAETERAIVRELMSNTILGGVFSRVAQPWFFHQVIARLIEGQQEQTRSRSISSSAESNSASTDAGREQTVAERLWAAISVALDLGQKAFTAFSAISQVLFSPARSQAYSSYPPLHENVARLTLRLVAPSPALARALHYVDLPCQLFAPSFNALVHNMIVERLLTTRTVETVLRDTTHALFPRGHPPPKEPDPTLEEQAALRERCERALVSALPSRLTRLVELPTSSDPQLALARHLLRPLSSQVANVHLLMLLTDKLVGLVFPELIVPKEE